MFGEFRLALYPDNSVYGSWYKMTQSRRETHETRDCKVDLSSYTCQSVKNRNSPLRKDSSSRGKDEDRGKVGYGKVGKSRFSKYARRKILHAGAVLDEDYQPSDCLFLTLTLPGSTPKALRAIAAWSGYLVHRLKAWVSKFLPGREEIWVWERQKRGALHLHWCFVCLSQAVEERVRRDLKGEWIRLLESVSDRCGVDLFRKTRSYTHRGKGVAVVQVERVRKSVGGYMAKYLSKESYRPSGFGAGTNVLIAPSRWFGVSRSLQRKISQRTHEIRISYLKKSEWLESYEEFLSLLTSWAAWCKAGNHRFGNGKSLYSRLEKDSKEKTWMNLEQVAIQFTKDLSENGIRAATSLLASGLRLVGKNPRLRRQYYSERSQRCSDLEVRYFKLQPMSAQDTLYLLTFLMLSFESFQRHVGNLSGMEKRWCLSVRNFLLSGGVGLPGSHPFAEEKKVAHKEVDNEGGDVHSGTRMQGEQLPLFPVPDPSSRVVAS